MDVADKIRSGARWLGAAKVITQVYQWVFTVMVMRLLVPEDYALMAMAAVFMSFIGQFEELGLRVKLVQMKEADYTIDYARRVFGLVLLTNFALVAVIAAASPLIADFFNQERLIPIILVLSLGMMIGGLGSIPDALIKRRLDFRSLAIVDVARVFAVSTVTLILAALGFGVWSLVWSTLVGTIVSTLGLIYASPFRALPSFNFTGMRDTLQVGGIVMLQRLVWWMYTGLDSLLIGRFYPAHALGIYGTASTLATLPLEKVGQILNVLSFTGLSRVNEDTEVFRHYLRRATKLVSVVLFPTFFGIAAVAGEFAPVVLGSQWVELGAIAAILALSAPARCIGSVVAESLNSMGKPLLHLRCMIVSAIAFAVGIAAGLPFGLAEIATGVVVASLIGCLHNIHLVSRQVDLGITDLLHDMWQPTLAGLTMMFVLLAVRPLLPLEYPSVGGLLVTIALGVPIYGGLIVALDPEGFRMLKSLIRRN